MKGQSYSLKPFPADTPMPHINIIVTLKRETGLLAIRFELQSALSGISIPPHADIPLRKKNLWEETCFEFFLKPEGSAQYWEFNLSPSGDWNVYRFESYRQDMQEEKAFTSLPFSVDAGTNSLHLSLELDMGKIISKDQYLKAAVSAVIKTTQGNITYWAPAHHGTKPDFHHKDCFVVEL